MKILDAVRGAFELFSAIGERSRQRDLPVQRKSLSAFARWWNSGADTIPAGITTEWMTEPYAEHPTVNLAIRTVATAIGQLEVEVWPKGARGRRGQKPIENHWLPALMAQPSDQLRGDQLKEAVASFMLYRGECFAWSREVARDRAGAPGRPNTILLLPPEQVRPIKDRRDPYKIAAWEWWSPDSGWNEIPAIEVTQWKLLNPFDRFRGLSPLRSLMLEYTTDHKAAVWNRSNLEHNAIPPIAFSSDKPWPQEDREIFLDSWENKYMGTSRQGRSAALPDHVKATVMKLTHQEMEFLEGRRFHREQILSIYGVPPAVAGIYTATPYATSREQMKHFVQKLMPLLRYIESVLTVDLLNRYERNLEARFKVEDMLAEVQSAELAEKVSVAVQLWGMGFPAADVAERLNLGLDTERKPWLKIGWLPFSVQPAEMSMLGPEDDEEPPVPGDDEDEPEDDGEDGSEVEAAARRVGSSASRLGADEVVEAARRIRLSLPARKDAAREARWTGLAARYQDVGYAYAKSLRSWLWDLRSQVLGRLEKHGPVKDASATLSDHFKAVREDDADSLLFDGEAAQIRFMAITEQSWRRASARGADVLKDETGLKFDFNFLDPKVVSYFAQKRIKVADASDKVRGRIRSAIIEGIREGETVKDIAARVRDAFDVERSRSMTIARTETAQAFNGGHYHAMRQAGIKFHEWLSSQDDRVRDSHVSVDGEAVAIGERFSNGCLFAGDPSASADETINCRCGNVPLAASDVADVED